MIGSRFIAYSRVAYKRVYHLPIPLYPTSQPPSSNQNNMPARSIQTETQSNKSRADRARRCLSGVGISREDSDDELGYEDHPWEWIYEGGRASVAPAANIANDDNNSNKENEASPPTSNKDHHHQQQHAISLLNDQALNEKQKQKQKKKRKRNVSATTTTKITTATTTNQPGGENAEERRIVGARMGNFECRLGDCVLLKAQGTNEAWVGLICEFKEDEEEDGAKLANIMWFSTEKEIQNRQKKRMDFMPVCCDIYQNFARRL